MGQFEYPLVCAPIPVPKVWAGDQLSRIRGGTAEEHIGESWDISTWPAAPDNADLRTVTVIANGPLAGTPLDRVAALPVVVKVIDSGAPLSVQCHPHRLDEHKNEMWYLFEANPDAYLYMGFAEGMTADRFCALLRETPQDEEQILGALACHRRLERGRHFSVPAPTVHALGPGLLTFEISERSQITYRLFDYNRERSRGKLDIEEGCRALLHPAPHPPAPAPLFEIDAPVETLAAFSTFRVWKVAGQHITVRSASHQHLVTACAGPCRLDGPAPEWTVHLGYTHTCLVPPTDRGYLIDTRGSGEVLISPLLS